MSAPTPTRHAAEKVPPLSSTRARAAVATVVGAVTTLLLTGAASGSVVSAVLPCG
jgi:hypothetical protein